MIVIKNIKEQYKDTIIFQKAMKDVGLDPRLKNMWENILWEQDKDYF